MDVTSSLAIEVIFDSCIQPHDNIGTLPSTGIDVPGFEDIDDLASLVTSSANMHISDETDLADDRNWILNENLSTMKLRSLFNSMQVKPSIFFLLSLSERCLMTFLWHHHIRRS